jgi:hypothetical protein
VWQGSEPGDLSALVNPDAVHELRLRLAAVRGAV